jgi:hypothetical protein
MAVAIKAINAKIRSNKVLDYLCSTRKSSLMKCFTLDNSGTFSSAVSVFILVCVELQPMNRAGPIYYPCWTREEGRRRKSKIDELITLLWIYRFLGSGVEFRDSCCGGDGYPEGPGDVRFFLSHSQIRLCRLYSLHRNAPRVPPFCPCGTRKVIRGSQFGLNPRQHHLSYHEHFPFCALTTRSHRPPPSPPKKKERKQTLTTTGRALLCSRTIFCLSLLRTTII